MIIYKITNKKNKKVYIGQTVRNLDERIKEHLRHQTTYLDKHFNNRNIKDFDIIVIDYAKTIEELNDKEEYWVNFYDCLIPKGYNMCNGGGNTIGFHHKEESKNKMSKSKRSMYIGENNPFYNKTHSDEQKEKWSKERKGLAHLTDEQIIKLRESHFTRKVLNVDTGEMFDSIKEAAERYGLKATHITRVCKGKRKTTGGYRFEYVMHGNTVPSLEIGRCND